MRSNMIEETNLSAGPNAMGYGVKPEAFSLDCLENVWTDGEVSRYCGVDIRYYESGSTRNGNTYAFRVPAHMTEIISQLDAIANA